MQSQNRQIGDVLLISHRSEEHIARIAGLVEGNIEVLYVNLRIADNKRWAERAIKIEARQIVRALPNWQAEHDAAFDASIKEAADRAYARMSPEQRAKLTAETVRRERRTPLDILIDRATGRE